MSRSAARPADDAEVRAAVEQLVAAMAATLHRVLDAGLAEREAVVTVADLAGALVADLTGPDGDRRLAARDAVLGWCVRPADPSVRVDPMAWSDTPLGRLVVGAVVHQGS